MNYFGKEYTNIGELEGAEKANAYLSNLRSYTRKVRWVSSPSTMFRRVATIPRKVYKSALSKSRKSETRTLYKIDRNIRKRVKSVKTKTKTLLIKKTVKQQEIKTLRKGSLNATTKTEEQLIEREKLSNRLIDKYELIPNPKKDS
jgi:hypothetical protein